MSVTQGVKGGASEPTISSMARFIAAQIKAGGPIGQRYEDVENAADWIAEAIVWQPEMQAIKRFIVGHVENHCVGYWDFHPANLVPDYLKARGLPPTVIEWVMS